MRLVKGSHIIVPKWWAGTNAYLVQNHDKRVIFINPYEGDMALIGTTDIAYDGRAEDVTADESEIDYLLAAVNRYFKEKLRRSDVIHSFSGVRPLFDDGHGKAAAVTRGDLADPVLADALLPDVESAAPRASTPPPAPASPPAPPAPPLPPDPPA